MKKMNIFLGDLIHNSAIKGPFIMPLNIGYVSCYAKKYFDKDINVRLFKYPLEIIDAIRREPPHILALGNYTWNADINYRIIEFAKTHCNKLISVLGGPDFPMEPDEQKEYLAKKPLIDFYVNHPNQGEPGFLSLLEWVLGNSGSDNALKGSPISGCSFLNKDKELFIGEHKDRFKSLDDIPSPYLTGALDRFFNDKLIPIMETDRGCPYDCTFCTRGKDRGVLQFDISRVKAELDYITKRTNYTSVLFMANANFGIFERDKEIAEHIKKHSSESGYPRKLDVSWAKNTSNRIIDIADILGNIAEVTMAFQALDPGVLKNIKRSKVKTSEFLKVKEYLDRKGIPSFSELILGLPGETKESHLNALKQLIDLGVCQMPCYNCKTLKGAFLSKKDERQKYGIKTKYRLFDVGFGIYGDIISLETDENVRSTSTLSEEDILFFRPLHWLIQFLWSYQYYIQLLKYLQREGIHPIDFMLRVLSRTESTPAKMKDILIYFEKEAKDEWFDSPEELYAHYSKKENFDRLLASGFAKMNFNYMFRVLLECRPEFDLYIADIAKKILAEKYEGIARETAHSIVDDLMKYMREICVKFDNDLGFDKEKRSKFAYNIVKWEKDGNKKRLSDYYEPEGVIYLFYAPDEQYNGLMNDIKHFRHEDRNLTLRKMSEHMKKTDLFYRVKELKQDPSLIKRLVALSN